MRPRYSGLPDENGRLEILRIHTAQMVKFNKLAADVDLEDLAKRTRNFSGAEIEGLVRSAQSTAMNKLVQVGGALYKVISLLATKVSLC